MNDGPTQLEQINGKRRKSSHKTQKYDPRKMTHIFVNDFCSRVIVADVVVN
jgi:hypothetical protein